MCARTQRLHRDWARARFECPLQRYGSAVGHCRGKGSACNRPGYGIRPLGGVTFNPTIELPELKQDKGNRLLESTNKTLCIPGTRRKEQRPHKRLTHSCLRVSRNQQRRALAVACCVGLGHWVQQCMMGPFEGGHHYVITSTIVWPQVKQQGGNIAPPITENWIKDLLSMAPPIRTRPSFPYILSHYGASIHLYLSIRRWTEW